MIAFVVHRVLVRPAIKFWMLAIMAIYHINQIQLKRMRLVLQIKEVLDNVCKL